MPKYQYDQTATVGLWTVYVDFYQGYGYYESSRSGDGGGLWFEGRVLVDYDGRYELPKNVIIALSDLGYTIS